MKKALIDTRDNRICQIEAAIFPVSAPLDWRDCPDAVSPDWTYDGTTFTAPPSPPVPTLGQSKVAKILALWQVFVSKHATTTATHAALLSVLATKRGEIAALTTIQGVQNYDNQAGWP